MLRAATTLLLAALLGACVDDEQCPAPERGRTMLRKEFVLIQPGAFRMGAADPTRWEHPQVDVVLTRPFWMQTTEVSLAEVWRISDLYNAYVYPLEGRIPYDVSLPDAPRPPLPLSVTDRASSVGRYLSAVHYANTRSLLEGYTACYDFRHCMPDGTDLNALSMEVPELLDACAVLAAQRIDPECDGYRLPTEAEWEYAARAGSTTDFLCGDDASCMEPWATIELNPRLGGKCTAYRNVCVGGHLCPNPFGLYDMYGNAEEWVHDVTDFRWIPAAGQAAWDFARGRGQPLVDPVRVSPDLWLNLERVPWLLQRTDDPEGRIAPPISGVVKGAHAASAWGATRSSVTYEVDPLSTRAGYSGSCGRRSRRWRADSSPARGAPPSAPPDRDDGCVRGPVGQQVAPRPAWRARPGGSAPHPAAHPCASPTGGERQRLLCMRA